MAITANTITTHGLDWVVNATSTDLSSCEELKAAVASKSHYIRTINISCGSDITVTIGEGETTGAVTTALIGPAIFTSTGRDKYSLLFICPIKLTAATALTVDASGAGTVQVVVEGYTE